jgi:hypothetical protein
MKWSFIFFLPFVLMAAACERHSASSLPSHGGHEPAHKPSGKPAGAAPAAAPNAATSKDSPAAGPKFFDQQSK